DSLSRRDAVPRRYTAAPAPLVENPTEYALRRRHAGHDDRHASQPIDRFPRHTVMGDLLRPFVRRALRLWPLLWGLMALPAHAVQIDGRIDPAEWQDARHISEFRKVQPLNGEPSTLATEVWILAT